MCFSSRELCWTAFPNLPYGYTCANIIKARSLEYKHTEMTYAIPRLMDKNLPVRLIMTYLLLTREFPLEDNKLWIERETTTPQNRGAGISESLLRRELSTKWWRVLALDFMQNRNKRLLCLRNYGFFVLFWFGFGTTASIVLTNTNTTIIVVT